MKGGEKNMEEQLDQSFAMEEAREAMDKVLKFLRGYRVDLAHDKRPGVRELSEAITCFETGSMWMNRSQFSETEYSPILPRE